MRTTIAIILLIIAGKTQINSANQPDYLDIIDKALYVEYAEIKMEVYKNEKLEKYYLMEFYRQGIKIRMEFLQPAGEKGRRMLNDETNMWMYLPRTSKVIKLPLKQPFMGSDASNRDLMRITFKKDYDISNIIEEENDILQVELKAKDLTISYNKVIIYLDTKKNLPVKQQMYSLSDKLIKTINYEYTQTAGGNWTITTMELKDELQKNSLTKMYYDKVKLKNNKPSVYFTLGSIKQ